MIGTMRSERGPRYTEMIAHTFTEPAVDQPQSYDIIRERIAGIVSGKEKTKPTKAAKKPATTPKLRFRKTIFLLWGTRAEAVVKRIGPHVAAKVGRVESKFNTAGLFESISNVVLAAADLDPAMLCQLDKLCATHQDVRLVLLTETPNGFVAESNHNFNIYSVFNDWNSARMYLGDVWPQW